MSEADFSADPAALPGALLRAAREKRKISREDVAQRIKYSLKQIEALEYDDYAALPALISTRGMVRSYAKIVGLDPAPLIERLNAHFTSGPPTVMVRDMAVPFPHRAAATQKTYWVLSGIVVAAISAFLVESLVFAPKRGTTGTETTASENAPGSTAPGVQSVPLAVPPASAESSPGSSAASSTSASSTPAVTAEAPTAAAAVPPPTTTGAKQIMLQFERDSWVEVRGVDGSVVHNQLHRAGSSAVVEHRAPVRVVIGAASGVRMTYDGRPYDLSSATQVDVARLTLN